MTGPGASRGADPRRASPGCQRKDLTYGLCPTRVAGSHPLHADSSVRTSPRLARSNLRLESPLFNSLLDGAPPKGRGPLVGRKSWPRRPAPLPAHVMMCDAAKLVTVKSERSPVGRPRSSGPRASQESSITTSPWTSAIWRMRTVWSVAIRVGHQNGPVRSVTISSIRSTSMLYVSDSTSTKAGTKPPRTSGARSVEKVTAGVITSARLVGRPVRGPGRWPTNRI